MEHGGAIAARYREFAPRPALRGYVKALFSFTVGRDELPADRPAIRDIVFREGEPFWSTLFADGHVSIVVNSGDGYKIDGLWEPRVARPHAIGPMSRYRTTAYGVRMTQVGAWLRPGLARVLTGVQADELTDRVVALEDLWGRPGRELPTRIEWLDAALMRQLVAGRTRKTESLRLGRLVGAIAASHGEVTVADLAQAAGVSRQHLTRTFRQSVGITPKLYARLIRFRAALGFAARGGSADWAQSAVETGYADQSHMISDFRRFSGLTPDVFVRDRTFHPFQERPSARSANPDIHWL
jgi:AraC-like DNA-binding protein